MKEDWPSHRKSGGTNKLLHAESKHENTSADKTENNPSRLYLWFPKLTLYFCSTLWLTSTIADSREHKLMLWNILLLELLSFFFFSLILFFCCCWHWTRVRYWRIDWGQQFDLRHNGQLLFMLILTNKVRSFLHLTVQAKLQSCWSYTHSSSLILCKATLLTGIPCNCGLSRRLCSSFREASIFSRSAASTM